MRVRQRVDIQLLILRSKVRWSMARFHSRTVSLHRSRNFCLNLPQHMFDHVLWPQLYLVLSENTHDTTSLRWPTLRLVTVSYSSANLGYVGFCCVISDFVALSHPLTSINTFLSGKTANSNMFIVLPSIGLLRYVKCKTSMVACLFMIHLVS